MTRMLISVGTIVAACLALPAGAVDGVQPGMWEYKIKTEMPGMPFAMPEITTKHCMTEEDARQGEVYEDKNQNKDCKTENMQKSGNKVSYDIVCTGKQPMKGHYEFVTTSTSLQGTGMMDLGEGQSVKTGINARRLGDCK